MLKGKGEEQSEEKEEVVRASGRGGFQKVGVKMVLTGRESRRDLKGEERGAGVGAVRTERTSFNPLLHPRSPGSVRGGGPSD